MAGKKVVGLLVGRENTFPGPFLDTVNQRGADVGVTAELAVLKPNTGGGWKDVYIVQSIEQLLSAYDQTGRKTMILQEFIDWDDYVRCICIGRTNILPFRYNPRAPFEERYVISQPLEGSLREHAIRDATTLVEALGYDMDTVEFAVKDDVLYAIDFLNPAPDFDNFSIKEDGFRWVLETMTDLVIAYALGEKAPPWRDEHRWWKHVEKDSTQDAVRA